MPSKARRSSKVPKQREDPPQFRILSRPSSPSKTSLQTTTDLSEFETPTAQLKPGPPKQLSPSSEPLPSIGSSKDVAGTPSRPQSMPVTAPNRRHRGVAPASGNIAINMTPSPRQFPSPPMPHTPLRKSVTPAQYYAGPSFHASPAASALPMPKFLSKSVPDLQKTSSLKSMMDEEGKSTDSEQSDNSPTLGKSRMAGENKTTEESDRDMFFPTEMLEKPEKQKENNVTVVVDESSSESPCTDVSKLTSPSTSPEDQVSHHARHKTESSIGGLFPLEIDDSSPLFALKAGILSETLGLCSNTPPIALNEEQRKAKSLELKKLLLSPVPQRSSSVAPRNGTGLNTKSPSPMFLRTHSLQDSSAPPPVLKSKRTDTHLKLQNRAMSSSAIFSNRIPPARPKTSNLRNQSRSPSSSNKPHSSELSASPTPNYWHGYQPNQNTYKTSMMTPFASGLSSQSSSHGIKSNLTQDSERTSSMEAYLRGVLKLDKHDITGANGIRT